MAYVNYNDPREVKALNMNSVPMDDYSVFPKNIYSRPLLASPVYYNGGRCDTPNGKASPRAGGQGAFVSKTWRNLPETFSRFSYDNFPNGYGVGIQTRGYISPPGCMAKEPRGMALPEFYPRECNWVRS